MKRDKKLIKEILLGLSQTSNPKDLWLDMVIKNYDPEVVERHYKLLHETGLIDAIDASHTNGIKFIPQRLTNAGHDYLESISQSWMQKIMKQCLNFSGKIIWFLVGGFAGTAGTYLASQLFHICK